MGPAATTKQTATFEQHIVGLHEVMQLETFLITWRKHLHLTLWKSYSMAIWTN